MGGSLNYKENHRRVSSQDITRSMADRFPSCNRFFPDCPDKPSLLDVKCRNCSKTDVEKKPRLEWVDCEFCGDDAVPVAEGTKNEDIEEAKCHVCGKMNSIEYIANQRN
jgi:ribosomal protein S27E